MYSEPVTGGQFHGREEIVSLLQKRADALKAGCRQNIALIGHRHLGKTSVLKHFLETRQDASLFCFYVSVDTQSMGEFARHFSASFMHSYLSASKISHQSEDFECMLKLCSQQIPATAAVIHKTFELSKGRSGERLFQSLMDVSQIFQQETGKNCIIAIDEFHRLGDMGYRQIFAEFGKKIMIQKNTMYLLASSSYISSKKILSEKLSLLFGNFERVYLKPFDFHSAGTFIEAKLGRQRISEEHKYFLTVFTDGHPFYLKIILDTLTLRMNLTNKQMIDSKDLYEAFHQIFFEPAGVLFQFFKQQIELFGMRRSGTLQVRALCTIASGKNKSTELPKILGVSATEAHKATRELLSRELILKYGIFYRLHNKIFKYWLKDVWSPKTIQLGSAAHKVERFERSFYQMLEEYAVTSQLEPSQRIEDLLSHFQNDAIEIDDKRRVLPKFHSIATRGSSIGKVKESTAELIATSGGKCWVCHVLEHQAHESDVDKLLTYYPEQKKVGMRVMAALTGIGDNAKLMAKDKKIFTLSLTNVNLLLDIYDKLPIVPKEPLPGVA